MGLTETQLLCGLPGTQGAGGFAPQMRAHGVTPNWSGLGCHGCWIQIRSSLLAASLAGPCDFTKKSRASVKLRSPRHLGGSARFCFGFCSTFAAGISVGHSS